MPPASGDHLGVDARRLLGDMAGVARYLASLLREWTRAELPFDRLTLFSPSLLPGDVLAAGYPFELRVVPAPSLRFALRAWQVRNR
jgi:hypothetical protein